MTAHDHREFVPGCFRCDLSRVECAQCGEINSSYGYVCERTPDHDGAHIEFRDNSTVAWGKP